MNIDPDRLERIIESGDAVQVVDVRSRFEYASGHVPGAVHLPFWKLPFVASEFVPGKEIETVLYCEHGPRAVIARAMLKSMGYSNISLLKGHMHGWREQNRELER